MPRMKRPKPLSMTAAAEAQRIAVEAILDSELGLAGLDKAAIAALLTTVRALAKRVTTANGLIDGYALNRGRGQKALDIAGDALVADSRTRFPKFRRRRVA